MPLERRHALARRRVPELDGAVVGRRRELAAVARERDRADPPAMPLERRHALPRGRVPELDGLVARERDRVDPAAMPLERLKTRIPIWLHLWYERKPSWKVILILVPDDALLW